MATAAENLAAVEAAIAARLAGGGVDEIVVDGQSVRYINMAQLLALQERYSGMVAVEAVRGTSTGVGTSFERPE